MAPAQSGSGYQVVASLVIAAFLPVSVHALKLCAGQEKEAADFIFRVIYRSLPVVFLLGVLAAELEGHHDKMAEFKEENEVDFSYAIPGLARFRVNAFRQRGTV